MDEKQLAELSALLGNSTAGISNSQLGKLVPGQAYSDALAGNGISGIYNTDQLYQSLTPNPRGYTDLALNDVSGYNSTGMEGYKGPDSLTAAGGTDLPQLDSEGFNLNDSLRGIGGIKGLGTLGTLGLGLAQFGDMKKTAGLQRELLNQKIATNKELLADRRADRSHVKSVFNTPRKTLAQA